MASRATLSRVATRDAGTASRSPSTVRDTKNSAERRRATAASIVSDRSGTRLELSRSSSASERSRDMIARSSWTLCALASAKNRRSSGVASSRSSARWARRLMRLRVWATVSCRSRAVASRSLSTAACATVCCCRRARENASPISHTAAMPSPKPSIGSSAARGFGLCLSRSTTMRDRYAAVSPRLQKT